MVSKSEEAELNRLESQVENGGGGAWEYLTQIRKLKVRRSDNVVQFGLPILSDPKLGDDEWTLYEQVAVAAMDCQCLDVAKDCVKALQKKFPRVKELVGCRHCCLKLRDCGMRQIKLTLASWRTIH
ncbi:hypothetical protein Dimus_012284 [Dionaea muscipula]